MATSFLAYRGNSDLSNTSRNLYNGNISYLTTAIPSPVALAQGEVSPSPMVRHFHYDKLNRITRQQTASVDISNNNNIWGDKISDFYTDYAYDFNGNLLSLNRKDNEALTMDSLAYTYHTSASDYYSGQLINRLQEVTDHAGATNYELDFEGTSQYAYDAIGNLITDTGEEIKEIEWNTYGKVRKVKRESYSIKPDLEFWYDPMGNRLCKIVKPRPQGNTTNQDSWTFTWYIRDAQGNMMATYTETHDALSAALMVQEFPMYGSSRLGVYNTADTISEIAYSSSTFDAAGFYTSTADPVQIPTPDTTRYHYVPLHKQYELSNHLGNVLVTVSARPRLIYDQNDDFLYKDADVMSVSDYFPFGMMMPSRHWNSDSYKFGFNGKENITEIKGWQDYGERMYNRLIGRFPSPDPLIVKQGQFPWYSPYQFAGNKPIWAIDLEGLQELIQTTQPNPNGKGYVKLTDYKNVKPASHIQWDRQGIKNQPGGRPITKRQYDIYDNKYDGEKTVSIRGWINPGGSGNPITDENTITVNVPQPGQSTNFNVSAPSIPSNAMNINTTVIAEITLDVNFNVPDPVTISNNQGFSETFMPTVTGNTGSGTGISTYIVPLPAIGTYNVSTGPSPDVVSTIEGSIKISTTKTYEIPKKPTYSGTPGTTGDPGKLD